MRYRFGDYEIDASGYVLSGPDGTVPLEPLVFDLIHFLARNPQTVLSRDALIENVWKGRIVSDATLSSAVKAARRALGDDGETQAMIRTVRGRGFQFAPAVTACAPEPKAAPSTDARASPWRPSLRVGPIRAITVTPELGGIADALAGNLTTVLTRVPVLQVVSDAAPPGSAGLQLRGDVQRIGENAQANLQLLDAETGQVLWARMFEAAADAGASGALLAEILPRLEPQLMRALQRDPGDGVGPLSANHLTLKAAGVLFLKGWTRATFDEAAEVLRKAIALDDRQALAHALLSLALGLGDRFGILRETSAAKDAEIHAQRALDLDDMDATVVGYAGCALADIGQPRRAKPLLRRAIDLDPYNPQGWAAMGALLVTEGAVEAGIEHLERGIELSPLDPRRAVWGAVLALGHLLKRDLDKAIEVAEAALAVSDRCYLPAVVLAAALISSDRGEDAAEAMSEAYRIKPDLTTGQIASLVGERLAASLSRSAA